jgi:L-lactate dehydrogenase (cytochrome)
MSATCHHQIEDLRELAKHKVPRMFYDYADSGSWTESTYRANEADFRRSSCASGSRWISRSAH